MCLPVRITLSSIDNVQLLIKHQVNDIECAPTQYGDNDYVTVTCLSECIPSLITYLPHFRCGGIEDQVKHGKSYPVMYTAKL